jgi:hypothetical protein
MAKWEISFVPYNLFELGTPDITGTPDTGYPEERLYDRSRLLYWKDTGTGALTFKVDQGATGNVAADILICTGHNFDGEDIDWQYDDDDSGYTDAVTQFSATTADIVKTISSAQTQRYWQMLVSSMTDPQATELCIGLRYTFEVDRAGAPTIGRIANVQWADMVDGGSRATKYGPAKKPFQYLLMLDATDLASFVAMDAYFDDYEKPFWFIDHLGDHYLVRFANPQRPFDVVYQQENNTQIAINLIEI